MGIQINGQTDRISAVDGSFSIQDLAEVNVTGVATASNFKSGTSNVHSTGYECTNINATGIVTAASANFTGNVSVGGTLTYQDVTNIDSVGVITARSGINVTGGSVGIGTDSPANILHLSSTGTPTIQITDEDNSGIVTIENGSGSLFLNADTGNAVSNSRIQFSIDGSERLRITSGGSVGFNTTLTQSSKTVHIAGDYRSVTQNVADEGLIFQSFTTASTGDVYPGISWTGNPGALGRARASINAISINDNNGSDIVFLTRNAADGTELDVTDDEKLRITSGGHVRINTGDLRVGDNTDSNAGSQTISVGSVSSGSGGIGIFANPTNGNSWVQFGDGTSGSSQYRGYMNYQHADDSLRFGTASSERFRISSSGLAINKNAAADAEIEILQSQDPTLRLHDTRNAAYKADFLMAGSAPLIRNNNTTASDRTFAVQKGTTDQLIIEGNGAVRKPLSPAFQASLSGGNLNAATHNNVVVFNNQWFDNGNNYNTSNGRFTAPVAGRYFFGVQIYAGFALSGVRVLHAQFQKNGSDIASTDMFGGASDHGGTSYHPTGCGHMLIDLAANDWVAWNSGGFSGTGSGHATIYAASGTRFFGYLVG